MKKLPFNKKQMDELSKKYPTPFYIYDEKEIRKNVKNLYKTFSWVNGFKNYFAVKALPNPSILSILREEGCGADCSSLGELFLSQKSNISGENIMFTSNDTPVEDFKKAHELGAIINFDDISHIDFYEKNVAKLPEIVCFRYNPGYLKDGNEIIGQPKDAKYGLTTEQIFEAYRICKKKGVKRFGLHTMVCSNEINPEYFLETIKLLFSLARDTFKKEGIVFEFINIGGGLGIPYKEPEKKLDIEKISKGMKILYNESLIQEGHPELKIFMESGRYITGPYGYLVSRVRHKKEIYKNYIGVDASMSNLMRPGIYGAYHHITVLGKENMKNNKTYDVTGSLCENNDKFAIDRKLPEINVGDLLVVHDVGAHGHAMGFQYNAKLRSAEFLLKENKEFEMIRRAENLNDYFSTLNF